MTNKLKIYTLNLKKVTSRKLTKKKVTSLNQY